MSIKVEGKEELYGVFLKFNKKYYGPIDGNLSDKNDCKEFQQSYQDAFSIPDDTECFSLIQDLANQFDIKTDKLLKNRDKAEFVILKPEWNSVKGKK